MYVALSADVASQTPLPSDGKYQSLTLSFSHSQTTSWPPAFTVSSTFDFSYFVNALHSTITISLFSNLVRRSPPIMTAHEDVPKSSSMPSTPQSFLYYETDSPFPQSGNEELWHSSKRRRTQQRPSSETQFIHMNGYKSDSQLGTRFNNTYVDSYSDSKTFGTLNRDISASFESKVWGWIVATDEYPDLYLQNETGSKKYWLQRPFR